MKIFLSSSTLTGTYYIFPRPKKPGGITALAISYATGYNNG
jgi:hypothetical protein